MSDFKIGQTVWDILRGKGVVTDVDKTYVRVEFDKLEVSYTSDGKIGSQFNRSLYFSKPQVIAETKPPFEPKLKAGQEIFVRDHDDACCTIIIREDKEEYIISTNGQKWSKNRYRFFEIGGQVY